MTRRLRDRHAKYFSTFMGPVALTLTWPERAVDWWRLMPERPNVRAAIRWALQSEKHELAAELCTSSYALWDRLGPKPEHTEWLELLAHDESVSPMRRGDLLLRLSARQRSVTTRVDLCRAALDLLRDTGDSQRVMIARANALEARAEANPADPKYLQEALALMEQAETNYADDMVVRRYALLAASLTMYTGGHDDNACLGLLEDLVDLGFNNDAVFWSLSAMNNLCEVATTFGEVERARDCAERGLKLIANQLTASSGAPFEFEAKFDLLAQLGYALARQGHSGEAVPFLTAALDGHLRIGDDAFASDDLLRIAWTLAPAEPAKAAALYGPLRAFWDRLDWRPEPSSAALESELVGILEVNEPDIAGPRDTRVRLEEGTFLTAMRVAAEQAGLLGGNSTAEAAD